MRLSQLKFNFLGNFLAQIFFVLIEEFIIKLFSGFNERLNGSIEDTHQSGLYAHALLYVYVCIMYR